MNVDSLVSSLRDFEVGSRGLLPHRVEDRWRYELMTISSNIVSVVGGSDPHSSGESVVASPFLNPEGVKPNFTNPR